MSVPSFQIQFPAAPGSGSRLVVPPAPSGAADNYIRQLGQQEKPRELLVCHNLLGPDDLNRAKAEAAKLYPLMLENTGLMLEYGQTAVAALNNVANQLLHDVKPIDIPEVTQAVGQLTKEMRRIRGKYDISDPRIREQLIKWAQAPRKAFILFGRAVDLIDALRQDAAGIDSQLSGVAGTLNDATEEVLRNINFYDLIYTTNEQEVENVIGVTAVKELVVALALADVEEIKVDPNDLSKRRELERKRRLTDFITNMNANIMEYKNRLFVGWTTSPNVTAMRSLNLGVAQQLDLMVNLTIPSYKLTVVEWQMQAQTLQASQLAALVSASFNEVMVAFANASAQVVPLIAEQTQTPVLSPVTIAAMANGIERQCEGLITAFANGRARQDESNTAIVHASRLIQHSTERVTEEVIKGLIHQTAERAAKVVITDVTPPPAALTSGA